MQCIQFKQGSLLYETYWDRNNIDVYLRMPPFSGIALLVFMDREGRWSTINILEKVAPLVWVS